MKRALLFFFTFLMAMAVVDDAYSQGSRADQRRREREIRKNLRRQNNYRGDNANNDKHCTPMTIPLVHLIVVEGTPASYESCTRCHTSYWILWCNPPHRSIVEAVITLWKEEGESGVPQLL